MIPAVIALEIADVFFTNIVVMKKDDLFIKAFQTL